MVEFEVTELLSCTHYPKCPILYGQALCQMTDQQLIHIIQTDDTGSLSVRLERSVRQRQSVMERVNVRPEPTHEVLHGYKVLLIDLVTGLLSSPRMRNYPWMSERMQAECMGSRDLCITHFKNTVTYKQEHSSLTGCGLYAYTNLDEMRNNAMIHQWIKLNAASGVHKPVIAEIIQFGIVIDAVLEEPGIMTVSELDGRLSTDAKIERLFVDTPERQSNFSILVNPNVYPNLKVDYVY